MQRGTSPEPATDDPTGEPLEGGVQTAEDVEQHTRVIEEYMKRLLGDVPATPVPEPQHVEPASDRDADVDAGNDGDQSWLNKLEAHTRAAAPEGRDMLSRMRNVANESTDVSLAAYQSKVSQATICRVAVAIVLLGLAYLSFGHAATGHGITFFVGVACWAAAAWVSAPLLNQLRSP